MGHKPDPAVVWPRAALKRAVQHHAEKKHISPFPIFLSIELNEYGRNKL